jgi:hypothetical protein
LSGSPRYPVPHLTGGDARSLGEVLLTVLGYATAPLIAARRLKDDAVGLKVRALHDRGFPRDVIDVFSARELYPIGELERLGAQHDEEFDLAELHGRLEAVDFTSDREYAAYDMSPVHIAELRAWVRHWLDDLGLRLAGFRSCGSTEWRAGCLHSVCCHRAGGA